jgi:hypothetical protein
MSYAESLLAKNDTHLYRAGSTGSRRCRAPARSSRAVGLVILFVAVF